MEQIKLDLIKKALDEKIASNVITIDVSERTPLFLYYVIATAKNARHASSMAELIEESFEKSNIKVRGIEGKNGSEWVLVDCGDILVHIFTEEERKRVSLETLLQTK